MREHSAHEIAAGERGFTLIELLVIIGIPAGIAFAAFADRRRRKRGALRTGRAIVPEGEQERDEMLTDYIRAAMREARYEILEDDGTFYGEIESLRGVWANADTLEATREELEEVLEEWIVFRLSRNLPIPRLGEAEITAPSVA